MSSYLDDVVTKWKDSLSYPFSVQLERPLVTEVSTYKGPLVDGVTDLWLGFDFGQSRPHLVLGPEGLSLVWVSEYGRTRLLRIGWRRV